MDTVFFIICKIYFRLVLSKRWNRREYYFESRNCDVNLRYAKNVIRNPDCEAIYTTFIMAERSGGMVIADIKARLVRPE